MMIMCFIQWDISQNIFITFPEEFAEMMKANA